jgi:hypothetical protein
MLIVLLDFSLTAMSMAATSSTQKSREYDRRKRSSFALSDPAVSSNGADFHSVAFLVYCTVQYTFGVRNCKPSTIISQIFIWENLHTGTA